MARTKQTSRTGGRARGPTHQWTTQQRLTLHLIHTEFSLQRAERTAVFNNLFAEQLLNEGFSDGLRSNTIQIQYYESTKANVPSAVALWRPILAEPTTASEVSRRERIVEQIHEAIRAMRGSAANNSRKSNKKASSSRRDVSATATISTYQTLTQRAALEQPTPLTSSIGGAEYSLQPRASPSARATATARKIRPSAKAQSNWLSRFKADANCDNDLPNDNEEDISDYAPPFKPAKPTTRMDSGAMSTPRKINRATHVPGSESEDSGSDIDVAPIMTRLRKSRISPEVVVASPARTERARTTDYVIEDDVLPLPLTPKTPRTPKTPSRAKALKALALRRERATVTLSRTNSDIMVTPEEFARMQRDLVPPTNAQVHPPLAGLFFRYWTDDCQSPLVNGEFIAGRYSMMSVPPPPAPTMQNFLWYDTASHMNRDPVHSPFVSVANHLTWIIRLAVQEYNKGTTLGRITVIDANAMDRRTVFHAQPIHQVICKQWRPFTKGAFRYQGMREFLVYHKIPRSTILNTFTVRELLRLTATDSSIAAMLRLDILGSRMHSYHKTVRPDLEKQNFQLNEDTVVTLARFARFLHLGMNSPAEHLMHLVSDVIQGWGVKVKYHAPEQWLSAANVFATSLGQAPASMKQYQQMKIAFLDGVRWSQGEFNTRHSDEKMRIMLGRAIKIGLQDPAKLICEELDGAKLNVMLYDKKQQKVLEGAAARALPQGAAARNGAGLTLSAGDATTDSEDEEMILYDNQDD